MIQNSYVTDRESLDILKRTYWKRIIL